MMSTLFAWTSPNNILDNLISFFGIWIGIVVADLGAAPQMQAQELSTFDEKIIAVLDKPKDAEEWNDMMKNINTIIQEIKKIIKLLKDGKADIQKAFEIYQLGEPKFIDHSISEPDIKEAAQVASEQFQTFHELRDDIDNLWDDFLDILSEKTGELLDYGVHGRPAGYGGGYGGEGGYEGGDGGGGYGGGYRGNGGQGYDEGGGYGGHYGGGGGGGGYGRGRGGGRGRRGGGGYRGGFGAPYR